MGGDDGPVSRSADNGFRARTTEMTAEHPLAWLCPLWQRLHGLDRPTRPTVDDAVAALREFGLAVELKRWDEPSPWNEFGDEVTACLCLPADRDPDIRTALLDLGLPHERRLMTTLWWPPTGS